MNTDLALQKAIDLLIKQKTMVLSTCKDTMPWTAPVYFICSKGSFYFFSSPRSRHIRQGCAPGYISACVFSDSDQWDTICGLQMTGQAKPVEHLTIKVKITSDFLVKFPFAKPFLKGGGTFVPNLWKKVYLYEFVPMKIYLVDNKTAFGNRKEITNEWLSLKI
ncbi:MAG: hypothetical protein GY874_02420 [Desulfobacteraceae bacterium]|nr:hypothetical protein [Desulfobacteraceae bacterium]